VHPLILTPPLRKTTWTAAPAHNNVIFCFSLIIFFSPSALSTSTFDAASAATAKGAERLFHVDQGPAQAVNVVAALAQAQQQAASSSAAAATAAAAAAANGGSNGPLVAASIQMLSTVPPATQNPIVAVAAAANCFAVARASGSITKYRYAYELYPSRIV
jgi:hypothetical protein